MTWPILHFAFALAVVIGIIFLILIEIYNVERAKHEQAWRQLREEGERAWRQLRSQVIKTG